MSNTVHHHKPIYFEVMVIVAVLDSGRQKQLSMIQTDNEIGGNNDSSGD